MSRPSPRPRRTVARPRRARAVAVVAVALLVALVAAACGVNDDDPVLSVNGWTLSRGAFRDELQQIADNDGYVAARSESLGKPYQVLKPGTDEFDAEFVAEMLNERVTFQLAEAEVAKRGLTVTDDDRQRAIDTIVPGLASGSADLTGDQPSSGVGVPPTGADADSSGAVDGSAATDGTVPGTTPGTAPAKDGREVLDAFGSYRDVLIEGVANLLVLQEDLVTSITSDDKLRELYEQIKDQSATQACVRHILVEAGTGQSDPTTGDPIPPTEDEYAAALQKATEIEARLDAGEDFATVAAEVSDDTPTKDKGGELGCAPQGTYSASFDQAVWSQDIGVVGQPVRSEYGYHLILVTERGTLTYEEMHDDLLAAVQDQKATALQSWLVEAAKAATVTVDEAAGTWDATNVLVKAVGAVDQPNLDLSPEDPNNPSSDLVPGPSSTTSTLALPTTSTTAP